MRRITITLTDEEYADLERRAEQERRTPREMAAYLVSRPQPLIRADWTYRPQSFIPYTGITSGGDSISQCQFCGQSGSHNCGVTFGYSGGRFVN